ncbi:glycosidase [Thermosipho japonicus]|uniref:Glycosidase n=1 Tax=Thermosipho japonicus TaxID=90323 RepID=A0A841GLK9_9BACT|nr:alpha-amylase family glycosyl hydrolase [Thermosipho japonicus]MBB6062885.1 glycosidase [Thermosipho japonicus]
MKVKKLTFIFFLMIFVSIFGSGCAADFQLNGKVLVRVNVNMPSHGNFVDNLNRVVLVVKENNSQESFLFESSDTSNIFFEIELLPGTYTFQVEGYENDTMIFSGEKRNQFIDKENTNIYIDTFYKSGIIDTIIEVDPDIFERYNITSAKIIYQEETEKRIEEKNINLVKMLTEVSKEVCPSTWIIRFKILLKLKDGDLSVESPSLESEFNLELAPAKTKMIKFRVYFDKGDDKPKVKVVIPEADPIVNLKGTIEKINGKLTLNWDYSINNACFYIYKEIQITEEEYIYEFLAKTNEKSYTVNLTKEDYDNISGVAIKAYFNGKESNLCILEKKDIRLINIEDIKEIHAVYNVDTNKLSLSWDYKYSNVKFEILKKERNNANYELVSQISERFFTTDLAGFQFWNVERIGVRVVANGFKSEISELSRDDIKKVSLNVPFTSSTMYLLFIRSFYDTDNDGIGDFNGVAEKVDYLKSLGVDTVWLLPFNKSKSYHGYDIEDYYDVEPDYGTLQDLDNMIKVLNENGIKIVMDLVLNHTSDTHPWFLDALENTTDSPYWDYYIMSLDKPRNTNHWHYKFNSKGQKVWYFGLFSSSMPDLNYDNPRVIEEVKKIIDFWIDMGVDGFRLDAAKHYYGFDWNDGIDKSAELSKKLESYIRSKIGDDAVIVSEVYEGSPEILSRFAPMPVFNFSFMYNIRDYYEGRDNLLKDSISWVDSLSSSYFLNVYHFPFIDNHDLVRFVSKLVDVKYKNDVISATKQYLLVNALLLSLTGMPTIYYGDEIGLRGWKWHSYPWDIPVREPMQWYKDQKGSGQTYWTKKFYRGISKGNAREDGAIYDDPDDGVSVEEQENGYSILNFFKEFINLRKEYPALAFGNTKIEKDWKNLYVLKKSYNFQDVLVLINLDPTYSNTYEIPEGYKWVWYAFFDGDNYEFGEKDKMILQNTNWTINPRQIYIFVK